MVSAEIECVGRAHRGAVVFARRETSQPCAGPAVTGGELPLAEGGDLADPGDAVAGQAPPHRRTHPPQQCDRLVARKEVASPRLSTAEPRGLSRSGGELGEELVIAQPDRHGDTEIGFNPKGECGEELGGAGVVELLGAAEVEKSFVD